MSARFVVRQERDAIATRKVVAVAVASVAVFAAAIAVSVWVPESARRGRDTGPAVPRPAPTTIGTLEQRLILAAPRGLDMARAQRATLERWGWVDPDAGLVRIPIERAMDILAAGDGGTPP